MKRISSRYFSDNELACKSSGIVNINPHFDIKLHDYRQLVDEPMYPNSCCRSLAHNQIIGGHERSLHVWDYSYHRTGGSCAIDWNILNKDGHARAVYAEKLTTIARQQGWSIGFGKTFIHTDCRTDVLGMPQAEWFYQTCAFFIEMLHVKQGVVPLPRRCYNTFNDTWFKGWSVGCSTAAYRFQRIP